ncbi:MAG: GWxTD domain-containing protein [Saprospiraceae bacterium]|nr:GWxTD domain-containing protein [Saprospiraceae bacterium]
MKKIYLTFLLILFVSISIKAENLQAYLSYSTFVSTADGPYIETYLTVMGSSVQLIKNSNNKFQGTIEVTLIFKKNDTVVDFKKYNLLSPEVEDTSNINFSFIDQQRFSLPNGTYNFEIKIVDINNNTKPFESIESVYIYFPSDKISISDIELIESFKKSSEQNILTKSGYDLIPYIFNYYPEKISKLTFYAEIYNTEKIMGEKEKFLITYYIESFETANYIAGLRKYKKEVSGNVIIAFNEFDLTDLPSGNYNLVIEIRTNENKLITDGRIFFQRSNPNIKIDYSDIASVDAENSFASRYTDKDSLAGMIRALSPISTEMEKIFADNQIKNGDVDIMQKYFLHFWTNRNELNPEKAWYDYSIELKKTDKEFGTSIRRGYETDRGRVYLQYGPPNTMTKQPSEPSAYPYEIWHFYKLGNQTNKKFVFYNPDMATNDYELIHSDAVGEIYNYNWQVMINKRNTTTNSIDDETGVKHWGNKSEEFFRNPR